MSLRHTPHHVTHHHLLGMFACAAAGAVLFAVIALILGWVHVPPSM